LVADLRRTASRYPSDRQLRELLHELAAHSSCFADLWKRDHAEPHRGQSKRKVIEHPAVGPVTLDCDVLLVATDDVRLMVYTAEPGSEDAERLALAVVLGTQQLVD